MALSSPRFRRNALPIQRGTHTFPLTRDALSSEAQTAVRGGGSILTLPNGSIAGDVRAISIDRRRRTVVYELRVVNETALPLATFAYSADDATTDELTWSSIVVPARSSIALPIELALVRDGSVPRLIVQLFAERAHLTLDGEPPVGRPRGNVRGGGVAVLAASLLALGAAGYAAERPRIVTLAVPPTVEAGAPFAIAYAFGSASHAHYSIERADGLEIGGGALEGREGTFAITVPSGIAGGYDIVVDASTPLGVARRIAHVAAFVPLAAQPIDPSKRARVGALALDRDLVRSGEALIVKYQTNARAGSVKLLDQDGTVRAEALVARRGFTTLLAPLVDRDQDMRVVVDVERGATRAEASAPVIVAAASPVFAARPVVPVDDLPRSGYAIGVPHAAVMHDMNVPLGLDLPPPADANESAAGPLLFPRTTYRGGETIALDVREDEPSLRVALDDIAGTELAVATVSPGTSAVRFVAPRVERSRRFLVVSTFAKGVGEETFVNALTIRP